MEGLNDMLSTFMTQRVKLQLVLAVIQWYAQIIQKCTGRPAPSSVAPTMTPLIVPSAIRCLDTFCADALLTTPILQLLKSALSVTSRPCRRRSSVVTPELLEVVQTETFVSTLLKVIQRNPTHSHITSQCMLLLAQWCALSPNPCSVINYSSFSEAIVSFIRTTRMTPSSITTIFSIINALLTDGRSTSAASRVESMVEQFCMSPLFHTVMNLFAIRDANSMIQLFRFFLPYFKYRRHPPRVSPLAAMHHTLLLCGMMTTMENAVNQYPRHSELAAVIQSFVMAMVDEGTAAERASQLEAEAIYIVRKGLFNLVSTTFLALSNDAPIIISSIHTLTHLCSLSSASPSLVSPLVYVIDLLVESPLLRDSVYTTRNHPFYEELWIAVLDLLSPVQRTEVGKKAVQVKEIQMEIKGCLSLLKDSPDVVNRASSLLNSLSLPVEPIPIPPLRTPLSPLRPSALTFRRIELDQQPLQQRLSTRAPAGTDFVSLLLFILADDSTQTFAYRGVECLYDLIDKGECGRVA